VMVFELGEQKNRQTNRQTYSSQYSTSHRGSGTKQLLRTSAADGRVQVIDGSVLAGVTVNGGERSTVAARLAAPLRSAVVGCQRPSKGRYAGQVITTLVCASVVDVRATAEQRSTVCKPTYISYHQSRGQQQVSGVGGVRW